MGDKVDFTELLGDILERLADLGEEDSNLYFRVVQALQELDDL